MLILIGLILLGVLFIVSGLILLVAKDRDLPLKVFGSTLILGVCCTLFMVFWTIGITTETAPVFAFYESNISVYKSTITDVKTIITPTYDVKGSLVPIQGSIEKGQTGEATITTIKDLRDKVTWYNNSLFFLKAIKNNPVVGFWYPDVSNLKPIVIE